MTLFENVPDRKGTRSVKWDLVHSLYGSEDVLPMWVADMDFPTPNAVTEALVSRAEHGVFGYTYTDTALHKTISNWVQDRHNWQIKPSWLIYSPGVVTTLHIAVQALTNVDDGILIQTPVYPPFYDLVSSHDRKLVTNPLKLVNNRYEIDFEDFEAKLKQGVKVFILCNPHNPVGRVWSKPELAKMAALCKKHDVTIFSDEIHADLIFDGNFHIPIASLSDEINEQTITCMSPTKTFNLAGLQASYAVIADKNIREKINDFLKKQGLTMLNTMGITALDAAYQHGKPWLEKLLSVLETNKQLVIDAFKDRQEISIVPPEGTYLLWMDCRKLGLTHDDLKNFMQEKAKVGLNDGKSFGEEGEGFMRMNIACPTVTVKEGIKRILTAINS
ncbi:MalY/PatB family protein [Aquibacillus kalidii]|uniref:MalY/PatB family protein n=1 Tax=Aquibacillus kalidii TaxID=2762597 RepID=UPI001646D96C|nr:PatB family C-S lyase [Aquibacillus kalidii]